MEFKIKAGRFDYDKQTKRAKVLKDQGSILISRNQQFETHFKWVNEVTKEAELDMIVFAGDAIFEKVIEKKNTFVLRFGMDEDRYFFWLQEKTDEVRVVEQINKMINAEVEEDENCEMIDEKQQQQKIDISNKQPVPSTQPPLPINISDMIKNLSNQLKNQAPSQDQAITHLYDVFTSDVMKKVLEELSESEMEELLEFMPEEQKDLKYFASNVRSPQFLQSMDVLSDALNSENSFPLFAEMRLDSSYLHKYYGVQAFLRALIAKTKQEKPKQQEK